MRFPHFCFYPFSWFSGGFLFTFMFYSCSQLRCWLAFHLQCRLGLLSVMLAIAHWPHPGRINSSSPTFRLRYVQWINGFSFRLLIFAVLDYILTSSLNSGLDTVSLTVLLPFQYLVFHIITLYFHSSLHYSNILWPFGLLLVVINSCCVSLILIFSILNI